MMRYFVTAIGTDSGKTLVSAILCEYLKADYWKPVQAGYPRDSDTVKSLVTYTPFHIHPEAYLLQTPASPHMAARIDQVQIDLEKIKLPKTQNSLVIEGAGGVMVPLNEHDYVIDLAKRFQAKIVLVSNLYLGSINHTLLTVGFLKSRNLPVAGLIFNGTPNHDSEQIIEQKSGWPVLLRIDKEEHINSAKVKQYAAQLKID